MGVNLAHAGMDQRKAHVVARQVAEKLTINPLLDAKGNKISPVAIHQNLIAGLAGPENVDLKQENEEVAIDLKMSKSKPSSAIFVHDTPDEIRNKIKKAYGPPKEIKFNPLINWVQTLVFWGENEGEFVIERPEKFGGNVTYNKVSDLVADYENEKLYPLDLKNALAEWLIKKLEPARKHFEIKENKEGLEKFREMLGIK
jgi:tyrosyl-tRNA synthetase